MTKKKSVAEAGWNLDDSYARLPNIFFSRVNPSAVRSPELIILNQPLAKSLGLNIKELQSKDGVALLAGNRLPDGALPLAQAYAGHQFGHFNRLGDGRAILLGEQVTPLGERFDIQLKGSGQTPYSRRGDGRATLGSMLREYIISEAMYALGIPTTRSLAVVTTGESVLRETELPGAILTRVASSHLRVGTFQYAASLGAVKDLKALADYTLKRHFPEVDAGEGRYLALLQEMIKCQAELISKWQLVGFIHGVMNTDNMTISGETIDYGPCAFMDEYNPATVFSSIDRQGRYAYGNQPPIAGWNIARFAETLLPLLHRKEEQAIEIAQEAISNFSALYEAHWLTGMRSKLGICNEEKEDKALIDELLNSMYLYHADYTNTFRALTAYDMSKDTDLFRSNEFAKWYTLWQARLDRQKEANDESQQLMRKSNPAIIPRNHRVEEALKAAVQEGDFSIMERFLDVLSDPYRHAPQYEDYYTQPSLSTLQYQTFCGT